MAISNLKVEATTEGYLRIKCDGRHDSANHFYLYYTPEEAIESWDDQHGDEK